VTVAASLHVSKKNWLLKRSRLLQQLLQLKAKNKELAAITFALALKTTAIGRSLSCFSGFFTPFKHHKNDSA
jgi:hypothetical protein